MSAQQLYQSANGAQLPYITVGQDMRGSACWLVVTADQIVECLSGSRAITILQAAARSKGLSVPR
jgi:hypothetical protein